MIGSASNSVELVITTPKVYGVELAYHTGCRTTTGALVELIATARRRIVIAAPFLQSGYGISGGLLEEALSSAIQRGVSADIVSTGTGLEAVAVNRLQYCAMGRVRLYQPLANLEHEAVLGSHAKFCIADCAHAYIGSANLTCAGLSGHLEMGVLAHGSLAQQVSDFWEHCVEIGLFTCVYE
jgi:phosphatidylserine/phosphatidylglycerophosphate/cardiolipin synthase-like enzyme